MHSLGFRCASSQLFKAESATAHCSKSHPGGFWTPWRLFRIFLEMGTFRVGRSAFQPQLSCEPVNVLQSGESISITDTRGCHWDWSPSLGVHEHRWAIHLLMHSSDNWMRNVCCSGLSYTTLDLKQVRLLIQAFAHDIWTNSKVVASISKGCR